ncbi:protein kinase [Streptomyces sp. NPDC058655]|uniref:protein kinase n=1 Tax=Streptomyces sp. NPDC058655 TaxID=3346577 RepID=UPI0036627609
MEEYAGRILAHRYRLPLPPSDEYELVETRAFDTRSGQEVLVRQVPLPEVVDAELLDGHRAAPAAGRGGAADLPAVRRAIEAAQAAAAIPDHPRLDQVFDVFSEGGSLWIVSELVPARPLAALIADEPLSPYRAAEVASDVLTALRVLHAHGWTHRNITVRTVLVCDDGRVVLTGLAAGAAEEALCGYDPVPRGTDSADAGWGGGSHPPEPYPGPGLDPGPYPGAGAGPGPGPAGWGGGSHPPEPYPGPGLEAGAGAGRAAVPGADRGPAAGPYPAGHAGRPEAGRHPRAGGAWTAMTGPDPDPGLRPEAGLRSDSGLGPEAGLRPAPGLRPDADAEFGGSAEHDAGFRAAEPSPAPSPGPMPDAGYAPLVAPGYDTGPRYNDHITPGRPEERAERPDPKAVARAGAIAAYRAGAQAAAARVTEQRKAVPQPRPEGSNLPQGYSYPYGGPDAGPGTPTGAGAGPDDGTGSGAPAPWHGATPRRQALPPAPEPQSLAAPRPEPAQDPALRPGVPAQPYAGDPQAHARPLPPPHQETPLPAQLALPQGYRQAEAPQGPGAAVARRPGPAPSGPEPSAPVRPDALSPTAPHHPHAPDPHAPAPHAPGPSTAGWDGPRTGLDAERARQTRMAVVGAVTERWAPEQAGPVQGHWQLAAPVGPATDLWALGALLYRAVQGHAPYPEDSVAELVEMVCAEPPAFAEECGALRPIVESLLRQDPTERPDFEELRGWLRSLVRSAPEPDAGFHLLPMPEPDPARLPAVRRRGELHGRHRNPAAPRKPRALGRSLLLGVLVLLAGAVGYAMLFMPRAPGPDRAGPAPAPQKQSPSPSQTPSGTPESKPAPQTTTPPATAAPLPAPPGYTVQQDPEHFQIAVPDGWDRNGINEAGQVRFTQGQFVLTVVPGRDKVEGNPDPQTYQKDKEPELNPYRSSTWSSVGDIKKTTVGQQLRVTARYTWIDGTGRNVFARNFVVALGGSYHVVLVTGPEDEQSKVTEVFEKATASYRAGG